MWEWDHKEGWALKNWCFQIVVLEKTLESPLDSKEIKPVNSKGNQPWIFMGRTDAKAEAPVLKPPDAKSLLIGKDPDAEKDWGQEKKGVTKDEMVGWHPWLNGHELEQTPEMVKDKEGWHTAVHRVENSWTQLSDWTTVDQNLPLEGSCTGLCFYLLSHLREGGRTVGGWASLWKL